MGDKKNISSDLCFVFKRLFETKKITKDEYEKAITKAVERSF